MWAKFKGAGKKRASFDVSSAEPPVGRFATRRKSVFAETYNPEDDDEDEGEKVKLA
jgi:cAMP-dependent protein kinase regulator